MSSTPGGWGHEHTVFMDNYMNMAAAFITGEDPPGAAKRISLHATERDANGLPAQRGWDGCRDPFAPP